MPLNHDALGFLKALRQGGSCGGEAGGGQLQCLRGQTGSTGQGEKRGALISLHELGIATMCCERETWERTSTTRRVQSRVAAVVAVLQDIWRAGGSGNAVRRMRIGYCYKNRDRGLTGIVPGMQ